MKNKDSMDAFMKNLKCYRCDQMFDIMKFFKEEPDTFKDLCKDYPIEDDSIIMIEVKKEGKK